MTTATKGKEREESLSLVSPYRDARKRAQLLCLDTTVGGEQRLLRIRLSCHGPLKIKTRSRR